jgi:hypothetical protein
VGPLQAMAQRVYAVYYGLVWADDICLQVLAESWPSPLQCRMPSGAEPHGPMAARKPPRDASFRALHPSHFIIHYSAQTPDVFQFTFVLLVLRMSIIAMGSRHA